jgi:hypothetical protein
MALGRAIQGIGHNPNGIIMARDLTDKLILVCSRLAWVERMADPEYKPRESRDDKLAAKRKAESTEDDVRKDL